MTVLREASSFSSVQYVSLQLVRSPLSMSLFLHYIVELVLTSMTKSSKPVSLDHNGAGHNVIHSPIVLKEKKCDERWKEKGNGEVLV